MKNTTDYYKKIEAQEKKDRFVASECLKWLLRKGKDLKINATDIKESVDLKCSVINSNDIQIPFNVEIKERFKNKKQMELYPNAELKVAKYKLMKDSTPNGTKLLYIVLLNREKCLVFNLSKIDLTKVERKNWRIKRTQMNPNSDYVEEPTYFIPYNMAQVTMDCSNYFNEYELKL